MFHRGIIMSALHLLLLSNKMKDAPPDNLMPLGGSKVEFVNKNRQLNYLRYYAKIFVQLCTL